MQRRVWPNTIFMGCWLCCISTRASVSFFPYFLPRECGDARTTEDAVSTGAIPSVPGPALCTGLSLTITTFDLGARCNALVPLFNDPGEVFYIGFRTMYATGTRRELSVWCAVERGGVPAEGVFEAREVIAP